MQILCGLELVLEGYFAKFWLTYFLFRGIRLPERYTVAPARGIMLYPGDAPSKRSHYPARRA